MLELGIVVNAGKKGAHVNFEIDYIGIAFVVGAYILLELGLNYISYVATRGAQ